jgi:potassium-dependent mechanosensitive channel
MPFYLFGRAKVSILEEEYGVWGCVLLQKKTNLGQNLNMFRKGRRGSMKVLLMGLMVFSNLISYAQVPKAESKEEMTLTDSTQASASDKSLTKLNNKNDTTISSMLMNLEEMVSILNKNIAILKKGFDTSSVSEGLPEIEEGLKGMEANLVKMESSANIRNLNSLEVVLDQVLSKLKKYQLTLNGYSETLVKISKDQNDLKSSNSFARKPSDSILRLTYEEKLLPVTQKWKICDSMLTDAVKSIGLLQSRTSTSYLICAERLETVYTLKKKIQIGYLKSDNPDVLTGGKYGQRLSFKESITLGFVRNIAISLYYLSHNWGAILLTFFLCAAFFMLTWVSVKRLQKSLSTDWSDPLHFLKNRIWLPTLLLLFTLFPFILKNPPAGLVQISWLFMMITATLIRWNDWPVPYRQMWYGIISLFLLFSIDSFLATSSHIEKVLLLILNLFAIVLGWFMYREVLKDKTRYHKLMDESIILFIIFNVLSLLLNLTGRLQLARILSNSGVMSITLLLALQIIREIFMEFLYLQIEAYKDSRFSGFMEFNNMKQKLRKTLGVITFLMWLLALAWSMNFSDYIFESVTEFLQKDRSLGKFTFTLGSILIFVAIIWISMMLGRIASFVFDSPDSTISGTRNSKSGSLKLFTKLTIYTLGTLLAFAAAGIAMDKLAIIFGALGVGIGFGLQNIVLNLVSGIILAIEKPMEVGDVIELGTKTGTVKEIGFRSSQISTFEGSVVIVPNGDFISQHLINWTHSNNNSRRVDVIVGVKYGSNLEQVKKIISDIISVNPDVSKYPAPNILIHEFANSAVNIRVLFWTPDYDKWVGLKSKIYQDIYESFAANNIEIPFTQTDLHIRSIDADVFDVMKGKKEQ